jgi:plasmid replication initiation protein
MKNNIVRKANSLVEASYKLSINQQKVVLLLASSIKPGDENFQPYQISIKDFAGLLGLKNKNFYSEIADLTKDLLSKTLSIVTEDSLLQINWLSSVQYFKGSGVIELCFDPKMKPYLLQMKERFTTYRLKEVIQLKSSFSIRIYELLKQYEKIGERIFLLETLRENLGIGPDEYGLYGDFKRRVLLASQTELAAKTNIAFDFEEIKEGRKVIKIKFVIHTQAPEENVGPMIPGTLFQIAENSSNADAHLEAILTELPREYQKQKSVRKLVADALAQHGADYVTRNIRYANDNSNATNPGSNVAKGANYRNYLAKTLKSDFGLAYQEDQEALRAKEEEARAKAKADMFVKRQEEERIEKEKSLLAKAQEFIQKLDPDERREVEAAAIISLPPEMQKMAMESRITAKIAIKRGMERIVIERYFKDKLTEQKTVEFISGEKESYER